jgi:hypothetical protein
MSANVMFDCRSVEVTPRSGAGQGRVRARSEAGYSDPKRGRLNCDRDTCSKADGQRPLQHRTTLVDPIGVLGRRQTHHGLGIGARRHSIAPKELEPCRRKFGVAHCVLDGPMAQPVLNSARVMPAFAKGSRNRAEACARESKSRSRRARQCA